MDHDDITLSELSILADTEVRTLRSWITEGLLLPPTRQGRSATYPRANLARALAIRAMREVDGLGLPEIRRRLWAMSDADIRDRARLFEGRAQKLNSASDYLRGMLTTGRAPAAPDSGTALLIARLSAGRSRPPARARALTVTVVPVTPDVALHIQGELAPETRADFEVIADLIRATLMKELPNE